MLKQRHCELHNKQMVQIIVYYLSISIFNCINCLMLISDTLPISSCLSCNRVVDMRMYAQLSGV